MPGFVRRCRRVYSLVALSESLRGYGNRLKVELVELLNRDLDEFVSLATTLLGTDEAAAVILKKLRHVHNQVQAVQDEVSRAHQALQDSLADRDAAPRRRILSLVYILKDKKTLQRVLNPNDGDGDGDGEGAVSAVSQHLQHDRIAMTWARLNALVENIGGVIESLMLMSNLV